MRELKLFFNVMDSRTIKKRLNKLIKEGKITMQFKDRPTHPNQKYIATSIDN